MENLMGIKKIIDEASEFGNLDFTRSLGDFVKYLDDCWNNEIDITMKRNIITVQIRFKNHIILPQFL